jgi:hypothetical protein
MMKILVPAILCFILCYGCTAKKKTRPLEVNKMKVIMWDLIKAGEWYNNILVKDSAANKKKTDARLFAQVFAIHGVTSVQYYDSYRYYEAHPLQFRVLVDSVDAYGNREKTAIFERQNHGQAR